MSTPADGVRGSAPPAGPTWNLWDRIVIVHFGGTDWGVAVETPSGHYEVMPLKFWSYHEARSWIINFEIEALS